MGGELALRVISSLVLIPLALGTAWLGGWSFWLLWLAAAVVVYWEWQTLIDQPSRWTSLALGVVGIAAAALALEFRQTTIAGLTIAAASVLVAGVSPRQRWWSMAGVPYAASIVLGPVVLRQDANWGFVAVVLLFAVVWATDIAAYFGGRAFGGAKLWERISPKKTWSGALSGAAAAILAGCIVGAVAGVTSITALALVSLLLSIASQAGDLFESSIKRRFGVKDSGQIIPGHGGVMDRLDGFVFAAALAALIGLLHAGLESPSRGLLIW